MGSGLRHLPDLLVGEPGLQQRGEGSAPLGGRKLRLRGVEGGEEI